MNEDDAKTKWCPERAKACAARGEDPFDEVAECIASDCMMWDSYKYYYDENGGCWDSQNKEGTLELVTGGDCGLKKG